MHDLRIPQMDCQFFHSKLTLERDNIPRIEPLPQGRSAVDKSLPFKVFRVNPAQELIEPDI